MNDETQPTETQATEQPQAEQTQEGFSGILSDGAGEEAKSTEETTQGEEKQGEAKKDGFKGILSEDEEDSEAVEDDGEKKEGEEETEEEYVFEYEPPEGIEVSEEDLKIGADFFKEHKIPKHLQKPLLDKHLEALNESVTKRLTATIEKTVAPWREELSKNQEYGGENLKKNANMINKTIREFGGSADEVEKLQGLMKTTPVFDNPALFGALYRMSSALSEGGFVSGKPAKPRLSDYEVFTKE